MRIPSLLLAAALLFPGSAEAQQPTTTVFLGIGPSFAVGERFEVHSTGFGVDGGLELPWTRSFRFRAEIDYNRFPLDEEELLARAGVPAGAQVELDGGEASTVTALGVLRYELPVSARARIQPYLLGGLGYWRLAQEDLTIRDPDGAETLEGGSENGVAGAIGAGIDLTLGGAAAVFVEGRYVLGWDFGDPPDLDDSLIPLRLGMAFTP